MIGERWVLTAAHVVEGLEVSETNVWFGSDYQSAVTKSSISAYHIHPGWPFSDKYSATEVDEILEEGTDIALIELAKILDYKNDINLLSYWVNKTENAIETKLYNNGFFYDYDLKIKKLR